MNLPITLVNVVLFNLYGFYPFKEILYIFMPVILAGIVNSLPVSVSQT